MRAFMKIFLIAFLCFAMAMGAGLWAFNKFKSPVNDTTGKDLEELTMIDSHEEETEEQSELERRMQTSKRINILLLGMEGTRTDTIIFGSFNPENKNIDLISIPRDTYYPREGYNSADKKKINAVYGDEGIDGIKSAVSDVLGGVPIHYYVKVTYKGVEKIVDSLGGIKVNVPMDMDYDDPYDNPPLHIHLKKGPQVLDGEKAMEFLRFRKSNTGDGYPDGDLGRIRAQQQFVKAALGKVLSFRLPVVANTVVKYVKTDIPLSQIASMAKNAIGIRSENLNMYSLPGKATNKGLSYFLHDVDNVKKMIEQIYSEEIE